MIPNPGKFLCLNFSNKLKLLFWLEITSASIFPTIVVRAKPWPEYPWAKKILLSILPMWGNLFTVIATCPLQVHQALNFSNPGKIF